MEEWIKNLILNFREGYNKLLEPEKNKVGNLDNLVSPLQIELIIIQNQSLAKQNTLLIFTHFSDEPDLDIRIYEVDSNGAIEKLQEILKDKKWQKALPEDDSRHIKEVSKKIFASIIENLFIQILKDFKKNVINSVFFETDQPKPMIGCKMLLTKDSFVWQASGDIRKIDTKEIADKILENAKNSAKTQPLPISVPRPTRIKGFGTYFYPAICIGGRFEPSFKEKVFESGVLSFPKKSFDAEYRGRKVVVNNNGFIAIGIEDKNEALRMLNEIMGVALLLDIPFYAIRNSELGDADIDPAKLEICGRSMSVYVSLRTALFKDEINMKPNFMDFRSQETREIREGQLIKIIEQADILAKDETVSELLIYLLESFTYFRGSEYNQAFIMEWMIIEKFVTFLWTNFIKEKGIIGQRKRKLEEYTADQIIEALSLAGKINSEYILIMDMKYKRNKFIHEGKNISVKDAEKGLDSAFSIVKGFCVNLGLLKK